MEQFCINHCNEKLQQFFNLYRAISLCVGVYAEGLIHLFID